MLYSMLIALASYTNFVLTIPSLLAEPMNCLGDAYEVLNRELWMMLAQVLPHCPLPCRGKARGRRKAIDWIIEGDQGRFQLLKEIGFN